MWTNSKSLKLTCALVWVVFALLITAVFVIPQFVDWYEKISPRESIYWWFCGVLYASLIPAFAAMLHLHGLLGNIRLGEVFVKGNAAHLRALSYCCYAECAIFFAFGFKRPMSFVVSFAAFFFGLILRVLKNVFEKAIELREENDAVI